jgi:hypothetical protein
VLRNYYINKGFMVSNTAWRVYRLATCASLGMCVILVALKIAGGVPQGFLTVVKVLLFAGAMGTALAFVAMEYFLFGFDKSSAIKKAFWFCVMIKVPILGPALYCFLVYSRSEVVKGGLPRRANSASA